MIFLSFCPPSSNFWTLDVDFRARYRGIVVLLVNDRNVFDRLIIHSGSTSTIAATTTQNDKSVRKERSNEGRENRRKEQKELQPHTHRHTHKDRQTNGHVYCTHKKIYVQLAIPFRQTNISTYMYIMFSMRFDFSYFCLDGNSKGMFVWQIQAFFNFNFYDLLFAFISSVPLFAHRIFVGCKFCCCLLFVLEAVIVVAVYLLRFLFHFTAMVFAIEMTRTITVTAYEQHQ